MSSNKEQKIACLEDKYKIVDYKTVANALSQGLDNEVNELIEKGWEVWGKPYIIGKAREDAGKGQSVAQQVMVKLKERVD